MKKGEGEGGRDTGGGGREEMKRREGEEKCML